VHVPDTAQSLVQDCFIRFWEKRLELSTVEDLHSYLFFMVRNRCIDHLRQQKRTHQLSFSNQINFLENAVDEKFDADELSSRLWEEVAKLPERCRMAFEYSRIDGFTYFQIAQKMGISDKAVEALISRALKILRSKLIDFLGILVLLCL
jgi:RNA polymerase sigma-70 factor (ECF subfamily)